MSLADLNRCAVRPGSLIAHRGYTVLTTDTDGWIGRGAEGFFLHQTRFLSRLRVGIEGSAPKPVSANVVGPHSITAYHLAPSPAGRAGAPPGETADPSDSEVVGKAIELQLNFFTGDGLHVDLTLVNHSLAPALVTLTVELDADFADFNEVLAGKRQQHGPVAREWSPDAGDGTATGGELRLRYLHPQLDLATHVTLADAGEVIDLGHALACRIELAPQQPHLVSLDLSPRFLGTVLHPFFGRDGTFAEEAPAAVARREWVAGCTELEADNPVVQAAWDRAAADLASLQLQEGPGAQPHMVVAGMPNYTGLFGRDAYVAALQSTLLTPATLRGALEVITPLNATETNDDLDAEPGKVLHQRQLGPLAQLGLSPFLHYYGDQSTPGLFLLAAATEFAHTGDAAFLRSLKAALGGTLAWLRHNQDERGFFPYQTRSTRGVKNQGWKDSGEAVLYPDGSFVANPIAMADIQALYYAGQQALGLAFLSIGDQAEGASLLAEAAALKQRFNQAFWMPAERFFAMALDGDGHQVRSIGSEPGACLAYGIVDADKAGAVAERLLAPDLFSGWGIRTLSSEHPAYNPFAYHLGTVWPFSSAIAAFGLRRYGFDEAMFAVAEGLFAASQVFDLDRLPEVFGGHARDARHPHPGLYPGACSPQAWSASAVIMLVQTMLGLVPLAPLRTLVVDPVLPPWLPALTACNIPVGSARVALRVARSATGTTELEVLDAGGIRIVRPDGAGLRPGDDRVAARVRAALEGAA